MNSNPLHILLVDDDTAMLRSLARSLGEYDFQVEATSCPAEANAFLRRYSIDVVICDYQMPGQTGLEFLTELRNEHPVLITFMVTGKGAGLPVAEDWAKEIGVHHVFSKPCDIRAIATALRDAMILKTS